MLTKQIIDKVIIYPTETVYGLGCSIFNKKGIDRINEIKNRGKSKSFILIMDSIEIIKEYVKDIPESVKPILNDFEIPTTIIYEASKALPDYLCAEDGTVGIRLVNHPFLIELIEKMKGPVISTSANFGGKAPTNLFENLDQNLFELVDLVIDQPKNISKENQSSRILKISTNNELISLR